jgi:hypothetical protein
MFGRILGLDGRESYRELRLRFTNSKRVPTGSNSSKRTLIIFGIVAASPLSRGTLHERKYPQRKDHF